MKSCSNDSKENSERSHGVFLEDGINTVRKNSAINTTAVEDFSFTKSNFLKLLEENMKLRASVTELNKTLGDEVSYLKHSLFKLQKEHDENTELLKLQAKTHFEDWKLERKEKYVAQSQVQILKNQLHLLAARFAVRDVRNRSYLYANDSLQQPPMIDHTMDHMSSCHQERKFRKNKSPSASKNAKTTNNELGAKENIKEHSHRRSHGKLTVKEIQGKHSEKDSSFVSTSNGEKAHPHSVPPRYGADKCKHDMAQCPTYFPESTGTKPKVPQKGAIMKEKHDNCDAKKRARTILASALQISPSSSGPSSPIQSPTRRHSAYLPITSTVLTPVSYSSSPVSDIGSEESVKSRNILGKEKYQENTEKLCLSGHTSPMNKTSTLSKNCSHTNDNESDHNGNSKTAIISIPNNSGPVISSASNFDETESKAYQQSFYIPRVSPSDSGVSCTSITVMSGSHGPSQVASSNSSRSSSPGISLMTFALNADGKGIPGAFYFALGSDTSVSQSQNSSNVCCTPSKSNSFVATYNSDICNISDSGNDSKKEINEKYHTEKIVNATWVRLMDKESKLLDSSKASRTARAVPSNELITNKRVSNDDIEISQCRKTQTQSENIRPEKCRGSQCLRPTDQYYFTSKDLYINSSNTTDKNETNVTTSNTPHQSTDTNFIIIKQCSNSKTDLKSLASRNISSAILSYESASKTAVCQSKLGKQT